jgi:hypothetical protein
MRLILAAIAAAVLPMPAQATTLPSFDSATYCAKVGFVGMTQSTVALDGCVSLEVAARTELADEWEALSPDEQGHCLTAATFAGDGSYALMRSCLARLRADAALGK